jgi:hypothetical protein
MTALPGGSDFRALVADLVEVFGRGVGSPLPEETFEELALRTFRLQAANNPTYRRFCEGRGVGAGEIRSWTEIPPVPTRAFKHLSLLSAPEGVRPQAVFRTSGTSRGPEGRGEHPVPDLGLYRAAALPNFQAHLLPEAEEDDSFRIVVLVLLVRPGEAPDSSLSAMAGFVVERWGERGSDWFVDPELGIRVDAFDEALRNVAAAGRPVLLLGTAFSWVHWMDAGGAAVSLPPGSRIMETGGFKGRSRVVSRDELYGALEDRLDVPRHRIVNEYGMTELLSQFYEPVLERGAETRWLTPPPWVRTEVLDPHTLEPVGDGERGLLCHLDLANAGSVLRVLTEDVGVRGAEGFRVLGRAEGSEPRGCSLAMEELLEVDRGP